MIDLDKQHEVFFYELNERGYEFENKTWIHGLGDVGGLFDDDQLNMVWEMYLAGQESKQAEIDSLKAQQKLNKPARIGGTVLREGVVWKTVIECAQRHYDYGQRNTQPTPLISPSDAIKLASSELVLVPNGILDLIRFMCETWAEIDRFVHKNCQNLESYPMIQGSKTKAAIKEIGKQEYNPIAVGSGIKAMIEAAQENSHE